MNLNKGACFYVGMNGKANIHFRSGAPIEKADAVTYLGGENSPFLQTLNSLVESVRLWLLAIS